MSEEEKPELSQPEAAVVKTSADDHELLQRLRDSAQPVLIGVSIAVVIFIGYSGYRWYRQNTLARAAELYSAAASAAEWQQVVNEYPSTPAAPLALLSMASSYYHEGRFEEAEAAYQRFSQDYPSHLMQPSALMGMAYCQEARGRFMQSSAVYQEFADKHPEHYLYPMAVFGRARSLEQAGQFEEARTVYEDFIAASTGSDWLEDAQSSLKYLEMKARAREKGIPYPPPMAEKPLVPPPLLTAPPSGVPGGPMEIPVPVTVPAPVPEAVPVPEPVAAPDPVPEPAPVPAPAP